MTGEFATRGAAAFALLMLTAAPFVSAVAQPSRRFDVLRLTDDLRCVAGPGTGTSLVPDAPDWLLSGAAAATGVIATNRRTEAWTGAALGHLRLHVAPAVACGGWSVWLEGLVADGGQSAGLAEIHLPLVTPARSPTNDSRGQLALFLGASHTREIAYDPVLPLQREAWGGLTLQLPDLRTELYIPGVGWGLVRLRAVLSGQADLLLHEELETAWRDDVLPHFTAAFPIAVSRGAGPAVQLNGAAFVYERVGGGSTPRLTRQSISLSLFRHERFPVRLMLRAGQERLEGGPRFRELALAVHTPSILLLPR